MPIPPNIKYLNPLFFIKKIRTRQIFILGITIPFFLLLQTQHSIAQKNKPNPEPTTQLTTYNAADTLNNEDTIAPAFKNKAANQIFNHSWQNPQACVLYKTIHTPDSLLPNTPYYTSLKPLKSNIYKFPIIPPPAPAPFLYLLFHSKPYADSLETHAQRIKKQAKEKEKQKIIDFITDTTCTNPKKLSAILDSIFTPDSIKNPRLYWKKIIERRDSLRNIKEKAENDSLKATPKLETVQYIDTNQYLKNLETNPELIDIQTLKKPTENKTILFYVLLTGVALIVYFLRNFQNYISISYRSLFNLKLAEQFFLDYNHYSNRIITSILLNLNIIFTYSLTAFLFLKYFNLLPYLSLHFPNPIVTIATTVTAILLIRALQLQVMQYIMPPVRQIVKFYMFNLHLIITMFGMFILPFLIIIAFAPHPFNQFAIAITTALLIFLFFYQYYQGFIISKDLLKLHKFHFLLYICTFEIIPILTLYKLFTS